jgi:hypothetical protein
MMEANILALNLAKQIIEDEISVDEARQQYAEAVQQHQAGNTPDIMKELAFEPAPIEQARDPDQQAEPAA